MRKMDLKDYQAGREAASEEMLHEDFEVHTALKLFELDPADDALSTWVSTRVRGGGVRSCVRYLSTTNGIR